jgi:hypothetical protein
MDLCSALNRSTVERHLWGNGMDQRRYLVKAQEAEAAASAAQNPVTQRGWENIAKEYRRLARAIAEQEERLSDNNT